MSKKPYIITLSYLINSLNKYYYEQWIIKLNNMKLIEKIQELIYDISIPRTKILVNSMKVAKVLRVLKKESVYSSLLTKNERIHIDNMTTIKKEDLKFCYDISIDTENIILNDTFDIKLGVILNKFKNTYTILQDIAGMINDDERIEDTGLEIHEINNRHFDILKKIQTITKIYYHKRSLLKYEKDIDQAIELLKNL